MTDTKDKKDEKKPVEEVKSEPKKAPEAPKEAKETPKPAEKETTPKEESKKDVKETEPKKEGSSEAPKEGNEKEEKSTKVEEETKGSKFADIRPGQTVRVHQRIIQAGKERIQIFEGIILAKKGKEDINRTITVRKISRGGFGVEKIFPLSSPLVPKVEIVNRPHKVRRSKLYYLREAPKKIKELKQKKQ